MPSSITLDHTFHHKTAHHSYTVHYTSLGQPPSPTNPPLIFVHGTPWSHKYWLPYALSLSAHFHIYMFDNPGFGISPGGSPLEDTDPSTRDDLDASLHGQAEVLAALYHHWQTSENWGDLKPHVIAHDNGGLITLRATILHGCIYCSLCLIDVVAVPPFGSPFFLLVGQHPEVFKSIPESMFEGLIESYIRGAAFHPLSERVMSMLKQPWLESNGGIQGKEGFIRQMQQADQRDAEEVAPRYAELGARMEGRVKIIWGRDDKWIPYDRAERLAKMIGGGAEREVTLIEEAGHLMHFDQPARLGVELGLWLARSKEGKRRGS